MKSFMRKRGSRPRPLRGWSLLMVAAALTACSTVAPPVPATSPMVTVPAQATADVTAEPAQDENAAQAGSTTEAIRSPARTIVLATTERDAGLRLVQSVAATFGAATGWTIQVTPKDPQELRVDMETAALAGQMPDLLWTHGQHIGPLVASELLRPVGDLDRQHTLFPQRVARPANYSRRHGCRLRHRGISFRSCGDAAGKRLVACRADEA